MTTAEFRLYAEYGFEWAAQAAQFGVMARRKSMGFSHMDARKATAWALRTLGADVYAMSSVALTALSATLADIVASQPILGDTGDVILAEMRPEYDARHAAGETVTQIEVAKRAEELFAASAYAQAIDAMHAAKYLTLSVIPKCLAKLAAASELDAERIAAETPAVVEVVEAVEVTETPKPAKTEQVAVRTLTGEWQYIEVGIRTAARARAGMATALRSIARKAKKLLGLRGAPSTVTDNRVVIARADRRLGGQHIVETLVIWA